MNVTFRDLDGMTEFLAAEAMQTAVWGKGDKVDPADLMMVIAQEGGLAGGAFDGDRLLGYVFAFPTVTPGVQHSHRLAVLPEARNLGLGSRLKWYQRDWCLARGIGHVRWTYDPLRRTNAILNIARLGAEVSAYLPDYYGAMEGINKGTDSDRLMADWMLNTDRVKARAAGMRNAGADLDASAVTRVAIPDDFAALLDQNPAAARTERLRVRSDLQSAFAAARVIRGFDPATNSYLLVPRTD